jgi:hypothetical protein
MILTFALVAVALFAVFWGGSLFAQGYLYQNPAERLPIRAAIAALLVGGFITYWVNLDKRLPGKYDTFFAFSGESTREFDEFEAVRWQFDPSSKGLKKDAQGNPAEAVVKFKKVPGGKTPAFAEEPGGKKFVTHDTEMMTAALVVPDEGGHPVKFKAQLRKDDRTGAMNYISDQNERRFVEENGSRYIMHARPGVMHVPSSAVVATALLLNFTLFAVWFVAFWLILRFNPGHALGFTAIFGLLMMLLILPLLFKPNREFNRTVTVAVHRFEMRC